MTPHHLDDLAGWNLHARAAADSLDDALTRLRREAAAVAAQIAAERLEAPTCLRSPAWGRIHALGGHGDPTATTYLTGGLPFRTNRPQALCDDLGEQVAQLAHPLPGTGTPLARIRAAIPAMRPDIAQPAARALHRLDEVARRHLRIPPAREPLPGVNCPVCAHRTLYVQTAGPVDAWTVVCLAGDCRLCTGQGCRCGMPGAVEGVAHIWPRSAVIAGAVAGATPTTTRKDLP